MEWFSSSSSSSHYLRHPHAVAKGAVSRIPATRHEDCDSGLLCLDSHLTYQLPDCRSATLANLQILPI